MKKIWWFGYGEAFASEMESLVDMLFVDSLRAKIKAAVRSASALWRRKL
jgi:hypothetical protein